MKHLLVIALALITLNASAQQEKRELRKKSEYTPEQIATLKSKRMALYLGLDKSQQKKLHDLNLKKAKERKAKRDNAKNRGKLSSEERFIIKNAKLDKIIAYKADMKDILNKEQYEKWERSNQRKTVKRKNIKRKKLLMKRKHMNDTKKRH